MKAKSDCKYCNGTGFMWKLVKDFEREDIHKVPCQCVEGLKREHRRGGK